jgi:hypothetical protein
MCVLAGALVAVGIVVAACGSAMRRTCSGPTVSAKLVTSYRPSQPTGWEPPYNQTIGGHLVSSYVTCGPTTYRLALLGFGKSNKCPNVVYESVPTDPKVAFERTLVLTDIEDGDVGDTLRRDEG